MHWRSECGCGQFTLKKKKAYLVYFRLGLLSSEQVDLCGSPLKTLCAHMERLLGYLPGEQDAIYLHHFIGIEWPDKVRKRN